MSHREYVAYIERLDRDMEILKGRCRSVDLTSKIEMLTEALTRQSDLNTGASAMKRTIAEWLRDCPDIKQDDNDLWIKFQEFDFFASGMRPHAMALELQEFAGEITSRAKDKSSAKVALIHSGVLKLAELVALFEEEEPE